MERAKKAGNTLNIKCSDEVIDACSQLGIGVRLLPKEESIPIIDRTLAKFRPQNTNGHLAIYNDSVSLPVDGHEFTYSERLAREPVYMFFSQANSLNKTEVLEIADGRTVGRILEGCFGMEYFLTNAALTFLIAVNWYAIEGAGTVVSLLKTLKNIDSTKKQ